MGGSYEKTSYVEFVLVEASSVDVWYVYLVRRRDVVGEHERGCVPAHKIARVCIARQCLLFSFYLDILLSYCIISMVILFPSFFGLISRAFRSFITPCR